MKKPAVYLILGVILILGFLLRNNQINTWPREGATFDEFAWTFLGLSIWEKGIPTSWSPHKAYTNKVEYYNPQGAHFTLVTPYLEHPPLFGIIAGGFARLNGVNKFDDVNISSIRPLALLLGILAIFAVFLLSSSIFGNEIGLLAAGIYSITPSVVIGSRLVQNENFFIPFYLLSLFFAHMYVKHSSRKYFIAATVISGLLPLAKMPWIVAPISVIVLFANSKKWREAGIVFLTTCLSVGAFLLYGYLLDSTVFINLWKLQLARYDMSFSSIFVLFRDPLIVDRTFIDGWIYFGWIAIAILMVKEVKKYFPIIIGFLLYGAMFIFAIPGEPLHGWYRYPFYPFLIIALAVFLKENFNKKFFVSSLLFIVVGLSMLAESWSRLFGFSYIILRLYIVTVAVGALPGIFPTLGRRKFFLWINYAISVIIILLSIWSIFLYNEQ